MTTPEIVKLLIALEPSTISEAAQSGDYTLLRYKNGEPVSDWDRALFPRTTADDLDAASRELAARSERAMKAAEATTLIMYMLKRYDMQPGEVTGHVFPRMSPEDQAEFRRLAQVMSEADADLDDERLGAA